MDIKKLDIKSKLVAGSVMAVMSGFVPSVANQAHAGVATVPVEVDIVTAITLTGTTKLDFGRLAITGTKITGNHTLPPILATITAAGASVVVAGTPGSFNIAGGSAAANVQISVGAAVTYNAGNISINQLTFHGPGMGALLAIAAGATSTAGAFAGGAQTDVQVGGRIAFTNPAVGSYTGSTIAVTITDIP